MRGLHLLIELARRTADEQRGNLGQISIARTDAETALTLHEERIADEGRVAANDPAIMVTLGAWSNNAARLRAQLRARHAELDRSEVAARDALRMAFADLKRLEMARDSAARRQRTIANRRADNLADERYASARTFAFL